MYSKIGLVVLIATMVACSSNTTLLVASPQASQDQEIVVLDDLKFIKARTQELTIWASADESAEAQSEYLQLGLSVDNHSRRHFEIVPAEFIAQDESGNAIKILSPAEHQAAIEESYRSRRAGASPQGLGPAFQDTGVGMHTGVVGRENYAGDMRQADVQRNSRSLESAMAAEIDSYLNTYTLYPGQYHTGTLWLALSAEQAINSSVFLDMPVAGEIHRFQFQVRTVTSTE